MLVVVSRITTTPIIKSIIMMFLANNKAIIDNNEKTYVKTNLTFGDE